jgi:hypothetical protein
MSLGFGFYQTHEQSHNLSHEQKQAFEQLLKLEQILRHPEIPNAVKGLEGMEIADVFLKEKAYTGILIGGLAEAVWNQKRKPEDLAKHKDVDVLVLDKDPEIERFEEGIDWWLKDEQRLTIEYESSSLEKAQTWYSNGNDIVLSFGAIPDKSCNLNPGLYIPNPDWIKTMRLAEVNANIDLRVVEVTDEVEDRFLRHLGKRIKTQVPKFIRNRFYKQILTGIYPDYNLTYAVRLEEFDLETLKAINKYLGNFSEN